jgi:hypothetical protein
VKLKWPCIFASVLFFCCKPTARLDASLQSNSENESQETFVSNVCISDNFDLAPEENITNCPESTAVGSSYPFSPPEDLLASGSSPRSHPVLSLDIQQLKIVTQILKFFQRGDFLIVMSDKLKMLNLIKRFKDHRALVKSLKEAMKFRSQLSGLDHTDFLKTTEILPKGNYFLKFSNTPREVKINYINVLGENEFTWGGPKTLQNFLEVKIPCSGVASCAKILADLEQRFKFEHYRNFDGKKFLRSKNGYFDIVRDVPPDSVTLRVHSVRVTRFIKSFLLESGITPANL